MTNDILLRYKIIATRTFREFESEVNSALANDYEPIRETLIGTRPPADGINFFLEMGKYASPLMEATAAPTIVRRHPLFDPDPEFDEPEPFVPEQRVVWETDPRQNPFVLGRDRNPPPADRDVSERMMEMMLDRETRDAVPNNRTPMTAQQLRAQAEAAAQVEMLRQREERINTTRDDEDETQDETGFSDSQIRRMGIE